MSRRGLILGGCLALAIALAISLLPKALPYFLGLEHWSSDWRAALLSSRRAHSHDRIALVPITEDTLARYPVRSPIDRGLLAELIRQIDAAGAKTIGLDIIVDQPTDPTKDQALMQAIRDARTSVVLGALDARVPLTEPQRRYHEAFLAEAGRPSGYLNLRQDSDGVVRSMAAPVDKAHPKSFALALAETAGPVARSEPQRVAWLLPPKSGASTFLSLPAHALAGPDALPAPDHQAVLGKLQDKIVIIGGSLGDADRHRTPLAKRSASLGIMPGMAVHAQIAAQLIDGRHVRVVGPVTSFVLVLAASVFGVWLAAEKARLRLRLVLVLVSPVVAAVLELIAFGLFELVLPVGAMLLAFGLGVTITYWWNAFIPHAHPEPVAAPARQRKGT